MVISISSHIYRKALTDGEAGKAIRGMLLLIFSLVENGKHQLILEGKATLKDIRELPDFFHFREFLSKVEESSFAHESIAYKVVLRITDMSQLDLHKLDIAQNAFDGRKIVVQDMRSRHEYLDITDATDYLRNDFRIYLENNTTDGDFVKEVYQLITGKPLRDDLLHTCGGVGEVPKVLRRIGQPLRAICIIDSDLEFPGHRGKSLKNVEQVCSSKGMYLKIWVKRMIENYLPDHIIKEGCRKTTSLMTMCILR